MRIAICFLGVLLSVSCFARDAEELNLAIFCSACDGVGAALALSPGTGAIVHTGVTNNAPIVFHCSWRKDSVGTIACTKENADGEVKVSYQTLSGDNGTLTWLGLGEILTVDLNHKSAAFGLLLSSQIKGPPKSAALYAKLCSCKVR